MIWLHEQSWAGTVGRHIGPWSTRWRLPRIGEPDVTLTDYGLALETALFVWSLARQPARQRPLRSAFVLFFASTSAAALAGGTVHGFCNDEHTVGHRVLWPATLIAIGVTALAAWLIGARLRFAPSVADRRIAAVAAGEFAVYSAVILFGPRRFLVAVLNYLPATAFLLAVFAQRYGRHRERPVLVGLAGIALTGVAAGVQQRRVALHPRYFNHNALYHLIQALALFLFFRSARWLVEEAPGERHQL